MAFFDRFKRKEILEPFELSHIAVDMHSHLIPGIDDGAKTIEQSLVMLAKFESLGYRKVITTPHVMGDVYRNTPEIILGGLQDLQQKAKEIGLRIEIEAAAEYYFDESLVERLKKDEKLLTFGGNCVLFEYSFHAKPDRTEELLFELKSRAYQPVLAHFERYMYYLKSPEIANELREKGVWIQVNLNSLSGHYGPEIKKQAEILVDKQWLDLVGSDCHRIEHLMLLEANLRNPYYHKLAEIDLKNKFL